MGIFAGIDLLAKFLAGEDDFRHCGRRFKSFVKKYFHLRDPDEESEVLWQLRNSMLHSFGPYSTQYRFVIVAGAGGPYPLFKPLAPAGYEVELITLHTMFEKAIEAYRQDVAKNSELQGKFMTIFPNYGPTSIGPV